jgi:hypothetical protein
MFLCSPAPSDPNRGRDPRLPTPNSTRTMLQLSLLPALVAPTFAPHLAPIPCTAGNATAATTLCAAELSRALPKEALGVLLVGDLETLLFGDEAGQWARFLRDERWSGIFESLAEAEGDEDIGNMLLAGDVAQSMLRGMRGGAFAVLSGEDFSGVMRVEEGWFERVGTLVRTHVDALGGELQETTRLGRPALVVAAEEGGNLLLLNDGAHAFLSIAPDTEAADAAVGALITGLEAPEGDGVERWWLASTARIEGASAELFVDMGATMDPSELEESTAALGAPGVAYGALVLGAGRSAEMLMTADFGGGPVMEAIASSVLEADTSLFSFVPDDYTGTILGIDVLGAIEEALAFAEETTPGASTDYDQGLEAVAGMLGVDLEDDLLAHLTGQILLLQPMIDTVAAAESMGVFGFGIDDVDSVVGVLEALAEAAAAQGVEAETAEIAGGSLWTFDPGIEMTVAVAAGSGFLAIGDEQGVVDLLARAAKPSAERTLDKDLAALASELDGCFVNVATIDAIVESLGAIQEVVSTLLDDTEVDATLIETLSSVADIAGDHLSGVMGGALHITPQRVSYRTLAQ